MSIAWTTIFVIVFLFPGILFYSGLYVKDRIPREVVRTGVIGEIALAVFVSLAIHLLSLEALIWLGFRASYYFTPVLQFEKLPPEWWVDILQKRSFGFLLYIFVTALAGFLLGRLVASLGIGATHKWAKALRGSENSLVTAYVMSKTMISDKVLMYRGELNEFYLKSDGSISYIVLKDCKKFYMHLQEDDLKMGKQLSLFGPEADGPDREWSYFAIDSGNIANILFERSPELDVTSAGTLALIEALKELEASLKPPAAPPAR